MKAAIKRVLRSLGYDLRRLPEQDLGIDRFSAYTVAVLTLIAALPPERKLRIVQVGANDGRINDPLYDISRRFADRTKLLLIEPQAQLIGYLSENYAFHPDLRIEQVAIGEPGMLRLHGVAEAVWEDLDVPYAKDWPPYRAPSGVVSGDREHVAAWLRQMLPDPARVEDAIVAFEVRSVALSGLVEGWSEDGRFDVLQIDTEGFDDRIIMGSDLERLRPKLIFFETAHLSEARKAALWEFLDARGYALIEQDADALALRVGAQA